MAKSKHTLAFEQREAAREAARLAARTPEQVAADEKASREYIAGLAAQVTRGNMAGVIKGEPRVLEAICRYFGFNNPCKDGGVYLTPRKIAVLFAATTCRSCRKATPEDDRLPCGDGMAHAACAMQAQIKATTEVTHG